MSSDGCYSKFSTVLALVMQFNNDHHGHPVTHVISAFLKLDALTIDS